MRSERRRAREAAMRALYQVDLLGCEAEGAVDYAVRESPDLDLSEAAQNYARGLATGVMARMSDIDRVIAGHAHDWAVGRMSPTDRNIMRIAVYEMLYLRETSPATSIDEAVEIAKTYGTADSPRFVNGILGALAQKMKDDAGVSESGENDATSAVDMPGAGRDGLDGPGEPGD